jgi:hypothetical protein
MMRPMKISSG